MKDRGGYAVGVRAVLAAAVLAAGALAAGCGSGSGGSAASASAIRTTVTYAEQPQDPPTYIFPFMDLSRSSIANAEQFQYLMYRPLYWFGQGGAPVLDPARSLAAPPTYSADDSVVTIDLNPYKWSNGETVTAEDVLFWMNMLHAQRANWAAYAPGSIPDDVQGVTIDSPTQLTMTLTAPVNTNWFTSDELSQITPMPSAWDVVGIGAAPDSGGCATAAYGTHDAACTNVFTFLSKQAGYDPTDPLAADTAQSTYATNPLWGVVDGPWKLTHFDAGGNVTFAANPTYSGPVKATIKTFREVPFTSEAAEFDALVGGKVDVGYLPPADVPGPTGDARKAGPNNPELAASYSLDPLYTWAVNYFPYNFNSSGNNGTAGRIFDQLYVRQAMQSLVDQKRLIQKFYKGYAVGTYGPVPIQPSNSYASTEVQGNPYPYDPGKAVALLKSHGWTVVPGGSSTCTAAGSGAGQCGDGIPAGTKLDLRLQYGSGDSATARVMAAEKSSWASAGIDVTLSSASFDTVLADAQPCTGGTSCSWQMANWGKGWLFSPDYYPTGEPIFQAGAGSNSGSYSDPINDANIAATIQTQAPLTQYENYLAAQLPVVWQPNNASSLTETAKGLSGTTPQNPFWSINPEAWRFSG